MYGLNDKAGKQLVHWQYTHCLHSAYKERCHALAPLIGQRLRQYRQTHRLTQWQLAERLGCTQASIAQAETGTRDSARFYLRKLGVIIEEKL